MAPPKVEPPKRKRTVAKIEEPKVEAEALVDTLVE